MVEFDDEIPVRPGAARPDEFPVGDDRVVRRCHSVIEEERLTGPGAGCHLDKFARLFRQGWDEAVHSVAFSNEVVVPAKPFAVLFLCFLGGEGGDDRGPVVLDEGGGVHLRRSGGGKGVVESVVVGPFQDG